MQQFVLVGLEASYPVPPGESRVGSDAACPICIRGEGILPVHAYLRVDEGKLLIRPAAPNGSSPNGSGVGSITVNGEALSGPVTLSGGQEIGIGGVVLRLVATAIQRPPLWSQLWARRWFRRGAWTGAAVVLLLAVCYAVLRWVILDPKRLREKLDRDITEYLQRDAAVIGMVEVKPFEGLIRLSDIQIKDRDNFGSGQRPFLKIPSATISFEVWPWLRSWQREYRNLRIALTGPELTVERSKSDGSLNIRDILARYGLRPPRLDLGLVELDARVEISGGKVVLLDNYANLQTSLEDIEIRLSQPGQGKPLTIEKCEMKVNASSPARGSLELKGQLSLLDSASVVDLAALSSGQLGLDMKEFDLARIFEHLGYAWEPYGMGFKVVLGKPISGQVSLTIKDARNISLNGEVDSASLVSIREQGRAPLGNTPMRLNFSLALADNGSGYLPREMDIRLRSGSDLKNPATHHLIFGAVGQVNPGGGSEYSVNGDCNLQELLGTDVGKRLDLDGRLGGHLQGSAKLIGEANGNWKIEARMESADAYAMVTNPADPAQRPVRQPLPLHFEYHASAQPSPAGGVPDIIVDSFKVSAPSFEVNSEVPGQIKGLDRKGELEGRAKFRLGLKGREFWRDFKPILALFGLTQPIEEMLDLEVTLVGSNDLVKLAARGKAERQWSPDPAPVELRTYVEFNRKAATPRAKAPAAPYLNLMLELASKDKGDKPLRVRVDAVCQRNETTDRLALEGFADTDPNHLTPLPGLVIQSDIVALRERFKPYIEGYLQSRDRQQNADDNGWLKLYRDTQLTGEIEQAGRVIVYRRLDPKSSEPDRAEFDLNIASTNLDVKAPLRAPQPRAGTPALPAAGAADVWAWRENAVTVGLKGTYEERLAASKEDPDTRRLGIERLDVKGSVGAFQLKLDDLDLFKLWHLKDLANQTWTDCVTGLSMTGRLDPPAYDFARSLRLLPPDSPFAGTLTLEIAFDRQKDAVNLKKFEFRQAELQPNSFLSMDVAGAVMGVRELSARLLSPADDTPFGERVARFIEEAGPAGLLDHLGEELTVNSLQIETGPLLQWLCKDYKSGARQPPALLAGLVRNDWQPEGTWSAAGVRLTRLGEPRLRTWRLLGAKLRNDLACFGAALKPGAPRPPVFTMTHDWAFKLGASVDANNNVMLSGDVVLDNAFLAASLPALAYDYRKPAGEKCRVELADCGYSQEPALLVHVGRLKVSGRPVALDLKDFDADYTHGRSGVFQVGELLVNGGPLPCAASITKYDPAGDLLHARISAPAADMAYLARLLDVPPAVSLSGSLRDISAAYKGSLVGLRATLEPNAAVLAQRFPKLEPTDPRLQGLNPESDALEIDAYADGLQVAARGAHDARAEARIDGHLHLTARDASGQNLKVELEHTTPQEARRQAFAGTALHVASGNARLNLWRAFRAPGVPVTVSATLAFNTAVNPAAWLAAHDTLATALGRPASPAETGERKLAEWEKVVASGTLQAPGLQMGATVLPAVEARDFTFKELKLHTPLLATSAFSGTLVLDADFDLSRAVITIAGDKADLKGLGFDLHLKLTDAELPRMLRPADGGKGGYSLGGRVEAQGNLKGVNLAGIDRLTWNGGVKLKLAGVACKAPRAPEPAAGALAPWAAAFTGLGPRYGAAFAAAASTASVNISDLAKDLPVTGSFKPANGLAVAVQAYLARAFGVEAEKLEFEPAEPTLKIVSGFAELGRLQLVGRGQCEGLDLEVANLKINLADEAFADEVRVYPVTLPKSAHSALNLDRWPAAVRDEFLRDMRDGKLALRLRGRLAAPTVQFPWPELHAFGRRALFGADRIADLPGLEQARLHFFQAWGRLPADLAAGAAVGDRTGAGLPATVAARQDGETIIDRVPGLPPYLMRLLEKQTAPGLSPAESLSKLLFPEPELPAPGNGKKPVRGEQK